MREGILRHATCPASKSLTFALSIRCQPGNSPGPHILHDSAIRKNPEIIDPSRGLEFWTLDGVWKSEALLDTKIA